MNGTQLLDAAYLKSVVSPQFKRRQARVSAVGICQRKQVAHAIGKITTDFNPYYSRAGRQLERWAYEQCLIVHPHGTYEQISVPTSVPDVYCHPDIVVMNEKRCIQVKSCSDKYADTEDAKKQAIKQTLLEWYFFNKAKYFNKGKQDSLSERENFCPQRYEILYLGREGAGGQRHSYELQYDAVLAEQLKDRFEQTQALIDLEILPEREKRSPDLDCAFEESRCPLYDVCWRK